MKEGMLRETTLGQALLPPCHGTGKESWGWTGPYHPLLPHPEWLGKLRTASHHCSEKKLKEVPGPQPGATLLRLNFCGFSLPFSYFTWIVICSW